MADFGKGLVLGAVSAASVYAAISALTSKRYVVNNNALCLKNQIKGTRTPQNHYHQQQKQIKEHKT